jgi:hypothetical protein
LHSVCGAHAKWHSGGTTEYSPRLCGQPPLFLRMSFQNESLDFSAPVQRQGVFPIN